MAQLVYLDGKLEFKNGFLPILENSVFSFGNYASGFNKNENGRFTFLRGHRNDKIYVKIDKNNIYFITLYKGDRARYIYKVNDNFLRNPVCFSTLGEPLKEFDKEWDKLDKNELSKNQTEKLSKLIENLFIEKEGKFIELHLKELKIYQINN